MFIQRIKINVIKLTLNSAKMKNLILLLGLILLLCAGCKYFRKTPVKTDNIVTADTMSSAAATDSSAYYNSMGTTAAETTSPAPATTRGNAVNGKYYMIVGCFTVSANADRYAEKIRGMGYESQIIPGKDNFQMVAAKSYDNYRESIGEIDKFRSDVTPNAWVYRQK